MIQEDLALAKSTKCSSIISQTDILDLEEDSLYNEGDILPEDFRITNNSSTDNQTNYGSQDFIDQNNNYNVIDTSLNTIVDPNCTEHPEDFNRFLLFPEVFIHLFIVKRLNKVAD